MEYDIVVIGTYFFDEIYIGLPQFPEPGREIICQDLIVTPGATYITVAALARLGVKAGWVSCFGDDHYSRYIYECGQQEGLALSLVRHLDHPHRQVTTSLPYQGERAFVTVSDPEPEDMVEYIVNSLSAVSFKHLHFSWLPGTAYLPVLELAQRKGVTISADCQDVPILATPESARQIIQHFDFFLPNARELFTLTQTDTLQAAIARAANWVDLLIVKDGANGSWIAQEGTVQHVPPMPVTQVIDTTGAGDCFNAGFLLGYVVERQSAQRSARYGNICGGHSVTGVGGTAHLLDREKLTHTFNQTYRADSERE